MNNADEEPSDEWGDDESTHLYQRGILDIAGAALGSGRRDASSEPPIEDEPATWFVSADGQNKQRLSASEVIDRCRAGTLSQDTLVWHEGLEGWTRLSDVPELSRILGALASSSFDGRGRLPPLPSPPPPAQSPAPSGAFAPFRPAREEAAHSRFEGAAGRLQGASLHTSPSLPRVVVPVELQVPQSVPPAQRLLGTASALLSRLPIQALSGIAERWTGSQRQGRLLAVAIVAAGSIAVGALLFWGSGGGGRAEYDLDDRLADDSPNGSTSRRAALKPGNGSLAPPAGQEPSALTFDEAAARRAMAAAARGAQDCRPTGGPRGPGQVRVRIEPNGSVSSAEHATAKFEGTAAGACISQLFRQVKVPAFGGSAITIVQKFNVPD